MELFAEHAGEVLAKKLNDACEMYYLQVRQGTAFQKANQELAKQINDKQEAIGKLLDCIRSKFAEVIDRRLAQTKDLQECYSKTVERILKEYQREADSASNKRRSKSCLPNK